MQIFHITRGTLPMNIRNHLLLSGLLLWFVTCTAHAQEFRWPEEPENLQVLPEGTKGAALGIGRHRKFLKRNGHGARGLETFLSK